MVTDGETACPHNAVANCRNILLGCGTSNGKTTPTNALLAEVARTDDREVLTKDTHKLQRTAANLFAQCSKDRIASLSDRVRSSLRLCPDRTPIGEVRGPQALDFLKAWNTGRPCVNELDPNYDYRRTPTNFVQEGAA